MVKRSYPATINRDEDGSFIVDFPDFDGDCFTFGRTLEKALEMARDALEGTIIIFTQKGLSIPLPNTQEIESGEHDMVVDIDVDVDLLYKKAMTQGVRKNTSIPFWLAKMAKDNGISLSFVLQEALKKELNVEGFATMKLAEQEEQNKVYHQAIDRYKLMVRDLEKIASEERTASQRTDLENLKELKDLVEQLESGEAVSSIEAKCFLDDINQMWCEAY